MLKMRLTDEQGTGMEALYFGDPEKCMETIERKNRVINITYYPGINVYMGQRTPQIIIQNYQ